MSTTYYEAMRMNHQFPQGEKISVDINKMHMKHDDYLELSFKKLMSGKYKPTSLSVFEHKGRIPDIGDWIEKFPSVEALCISRDLIPFKKSNLDHLKAFVLMDFCDQNLIEKSHEHLWPADQILPNVKFFTHLKHISHGKQEFDLAGLGSDNLPNLEWIRCYLDEKGKLLELISRFKQLTALSIDNFVRNHDIFGVLKNRIRILYLGGFTKGFSFDELPNQTNLEILCINGYRYDFNLELLSKLRLKEIQLLNCPKIIHSEVLLEMKHLESLMILSCKNALSKELKTKLKERALHHLDIDFA